MTSRDDIPTAAPWSIVRDDAVDAYQVVDATERTICSVPIGNTKQDIHRQQAVRDLVLAAPSLYGSVQQALAGLNEPDPNLEAVRAVLWRALSAARGQL